MLRMLFAFLSLCISYSAQAYTLTASNNTPAVVDGASMVFPAIGPFFQCQDWLPPDASVTCFADRSVTLGPGTVKDVDIRVRFSKPDFEGETYMNLRHNGVDVTLIPFVHFGAEDGAGPFEILFDDGADEILKCIGTGAEIPACTQQTPGTYKPIGGLLAAFNGLNAAGEWTLTVADGDSGDFLTLLGFDLIVQVVPEPTAAALLAAPALALWGTRRRRSA